MKVGIDTIKDIVANRTRFEHDTPDFNRAVTAAGEAYVLGYTAALSDSGKLIHANDLLVTACKRLIQSRMRITDGVAQIDESSIEELRNAIEKAEDRS